MTASLTTTNFYDVLSQRNLVAQCTDEHIKKRLTKPITAYCGFDPTADSLHIGSLVPIMGLAHLQRAGHRPVVLVGGATGLVGDPSGKTQTRQMLTEEQVSCNARAIAKQIGAIVKFGDGPTDAKLVNNIDWFANITWIDLLRQVGSKMSVSRMLTMDSVKGRMGGQGDGISYLEFSYMVMQAYDFVKLNQLENCTVQLGGQDQWGNIVMGIELGRKMCQADLAGLTFPLVTKSDGGKFGKSEQGNIWLDPVRTSPYDFYQFWRNVADVDVGKFLGYFTFLPIDQIKQLASATGQELNASKTVLAYQVTQLVHGQTEADKAQKAAQGAFGGAKDVTGQSIPSAALQASDLNQGIGLLALLVQAKLAASNSEARRHVQGGAVRIHENKIDDANKVVTSDDVQDGYILLRVGKKRLFRFDVV